jgi:hypothetical protein
MLTEEDDVEIHALAARDRTVAAISRHTGREPKTIRKYLTGPAEARRERAPSCWSRFATTWPRGWPKTPMLMAPCWVRDHELGSAPRGLGAMELVELVRGQQASGVGSAALEAPHPLRAVETLRSEAARLRFGVILGSRPAASIRAAAARLMRA